MVAIASPGLKTGDLDVTVTQATIEDQERIGRFLRVAYGDRAQYKFPKRWFWEFVDNPYRSDKRLPIWLAEADGRIVGQTCEMVIPFKLGDRIYPAAWGVDYIVLPEYRRRGIGRLLQQAQAEYHDIFMALTMSPISRRVLVDMGFEEANPAIELHKTIRMSPEQARKIVGSRLGAGNVLSAACRARWSAMALTTAFNGFMRLRDLLRTRATIRTIAVQRIERFGDESDKLWARLARRFPVIVKRDAAYLNWKFTDQPHVDYDKFVARRKQTVCGYVITRTGTPPEARVGIIADLFAAPDDDVVIRHLLVHAVEHLRHKGVTGIIAASSVHEYIAHFLKHGFRRTRDVVPVFRSRTVDPMPNIGWFMGMGDHDWDQYPMITETESGAG